jgi:hypothetical protein
MGEHNGRRAEKQEAEAIRAGTVSIANQIDTARPIIPLGS